MDFQKFVEENLHLIKTNVNSKSKKLIPSTYASPKHKDKVNLENSGSPVSTRRLSLRSSSTIDLTSDSFQACEPEVIVLDDGLGLDHTIRSKNCNKTVEIIDLEETSQSLPTTSKSVGCGIQVEEIKCLNPSVCSITSENEVTIIKSNFGQKNQFSNLRRSKRQSNRYVETPRKSEAYKHINSKQRLDYASNNSKLSVESKRKVKGPQRKKRKLCDVSNIISTSTPKADLHNTKPLSGKLFSTFIVVGDVEGSLKLFSTRGNPKSARPMA